SIFGGQPSITTPIPPPCDSPKVAMRKSWPKTLPILEAEDSHLGCLGERASSLFFCDHRQDAHRPIQAGCPSSVQTASSAVLRSSIKSRRSSTPTDNRTSESPMPSSSRFSFGTEAWVISAG